MKDKSNETLRTEFSKVTVKVGESLVSACFSADIKYFPSQAVSDERLVSPVAVC